LNDARERTVLDHEHAKMFASAVASKGKGILKVDPAVQSNIVIVDVVKDDMTSAAFVDRISRVTGSERIECPGTSAVIKTYPCGPKAVRFVLYSSLSKEDVQRAIDKIIYVVNEYRN